MSLEARRHRADLIEVFKIMRGFDRIPVHDLFQLKSHQKSCMVTRGHALSILKQRPHLMLRRCYFSQRVIDDWNSLPPESVKAKTVLQFKKSVGPLFKKLG
ncbi:hypothetical protein HOLleu_15563 [Holothuria leucospilota]|uniref:Uncharacterized protein n=1 Tax=Holothuria leucospilota TaxID=206669 RepID=A0A9Q1C4D6_HOLLE|nr:hypothetical protein HOLleu_15563 [Holothuria leucospilota]